MFASLRTVFDGRGQLSGRPSLHPETGHVVSAALLDHPLARAVGGRLWRRGRTSHVERRALRQSDAVHFPRSISGIIHLRSLCATVNE